MKRVFITIILVSITLISCSKESPKPFRIYEPEVFVLSLGEIGWEAICKVKVEGFAEIEKDDQYTVNLDLNLDLITPQKDTLKNFASQTLNETINEKHYHYLILEASGSIDAQHGIGTYEAVYFIRDNITNKTALLIKTFEVD